MNTNEIKTYADIIAQLAATRTEQAVQARQNAKDLIERTLAAQREALAPLLDIMKEAIERFDTFTMREGNNDVFGHGTPAFYVTFEIGELSRRPYNAFGRHMFLRIIVKDGRAMMEKVSHYTGGGSHLISSASLDNAKELIPVLLGVIADMVRPS